METGEGRGERRGREEKEGWGDYFPKSGGIRKNWELIKRERNLEI